MAYCGRSWPLPSGCISCSAIIEPQTLLRASIIASLNVRRVIPRCTRGVHPRAVRDSSSRRESHVRVFLFSHASRLATRLFTARGTRERQSWIYNFVTRLREEEVAERLSAGSLRFAREKKRGANGGKLERRARKEFSPPWQPQQLGGDEARLLFRNPSIRDRSWLESRAMKPSVKFRAPRDVDFPRSRGENTVPDPESAKISDTRDSTAPLIRFVSLAAGTVCCLPND